MTINIGFQTLDYCIFGISLLISVGVGFYNAFKGKRIDRSASSSTAVVDAFLMGDRNLSVLPLTISLAVSVVSAITLLGLPAEMYTQGSQYIFNIGSGLGIVLTTLIFVPLLHPLRLTSMFEYLERRFSSKSVRTCGSFMEVLALILYGGTALYAPAAALATVTPVATWAWCLGLGVVVTLYTCLGGLRAVIWTDVFQASIMILGLIAVFIQGLITVGGITEVYKFTSEENRLQFYNFDPDPRTRHTFYGLTFGFSFGSLAFYGASQFTFQRYSATKRLSDAKKVVLLNLPIFYFFHVLLCCTGLLIIAYYSKLGCDPLKSKRIMSSNQILPLFVLDTMGQVPAFLGLFMAALTGSALSTVSSVINSASALLWQDFLKEFIGHKVAENVAVLINKVLATFTGLCVTLLTFLAHNFGPHIFQVCFAFLGASGGPQLGMFLLGAIIPWANAKGALVGCFGALLFTGWITAGTYVTKPFSAQLPALSTQFCPNVTASNITISIGADSQSFVGIVELYKVSYVWYSLIGAFTCIIIGVLVSLCTENDEPADALVLPWYRHVKHFLVNCRLSNCDKIVSEAVEENSVMLKTERENCDKIVSEAVEENSVMLKTDRENCDKIVSEAVEENSVMLKTERENSDKIVSEAVEENSVMLKTDRENCDKIVSEAVEENSVMLKTDRENSDKIVSEAVEENSVMLKTDRDNSDKIVSEAVEENSVMLKTERDNSQNSCDHLSHAAEAKLTKTTL